MTLPKVLFKGKFGASDITINFSKESGRKVALSTENKLKDIWEQIKEEAKQKGTKVWDSSLYRLDDFSIVNGELSLNLSTVPFSIAKSMNRYLDVLYKLGEDYFSKSLFTASLIKTSDDKYVFGELTENYLTSGKVDLIGGVLSRSEGEIITGTDLFNALYNEFQEELGVTVDLIKNCTLKGAILSEKLKVGLIFDTYLSINSEHLRRNFTATNNDEIKRLRFVTKSDLTKTFNKIVGFGTEVRNVI